MDRITVGVVIFALIAITTIGGLLYRYNDLQKASGRNATIQECIKQKRTTIVKYDYDMKDWYLISCGKTER